MSSLPLCDGEEAAYEWPCMRCKKPFLPKRITRFKGSPFQRYCDSCQTLNLLEMIFKEDAPEDQATESR